MVAGGAGAAYVRRAVVELAVDSGVEYAQALGTIVFSVLMFVLGVMAVNQLQIDTGAIWLVAGWGLASLGLGLGLSFVELPRLRLTFAQAWRLWTLDEETCRAALDRLVDEGFLYRMSDGRFAARVAA